MTTPMQALTVTPDSSRTIEFKVLLALSTSVLLMHVAVLQTTHLRLILRPPALSDVFTTRTIESSPPVVAAAPELPVVPPQAVPTRKKSLRPANKESSPPTGLPSGTDNSNPDQSSPNQVITSSAMKKDGLASGVEPPANAPLPSSRELAALVNAVTLPNSVRIKYQVETNKFPYRLNAELRWQQNGESYDARLELNAFGLTRVQTSQGQINAQGLAPIRFSDKYRSEVAAHFNRDLGKVTFSANTPDVPLLAGAQDRLSILVQLGASVASAPGRYPAATTISTQTIGPRDADMWLFTVGSQETLSLPGGELATLKLVRNPRQEFDQKVEVWLSPALGYLPARIRITEQNGDFVDQKWLATEPLVIR